MTQLDLFYRAFREYRKLLQKDRGHSLLKNAIISADDRDKIVVTKTTCQIDEDWVDAIEQGLIFIGKAIGEERQFIRSNGEVQIIEKVKHISRESVEHLARHSDYISQRPKSEDDDIMPKKLYTVERLNDYTVYENRFLYLLLSQLKDFIGLRYNQIVKLTNTYRGSITMKKSVTEGKHRLDYELNLKESREDDWYLRSHNEAESVLNRLESMLRTVHYYLRTPLMMEVAKADKIKPPITKTNILRMDKNFKETVALYEFLLAYNKDGYTIRHEEKLLDPLTDSVAEALSEPILLMSFLAYQHGLGLEGYLKEEFEKEEICRKEEEKRLLLEQLEKLRKRMNSSEWNPEEYILLLENVNRELKKDSDQLILAKEEIRGLHAEAESLRGTITTLNDQIAAMKEAHAKEVDEFYAKIEALSRAQAEEAAAYAEALVKTEQEKREEIERIRAEKEESLREKDACLTENNRELEESRTAWAAAEREKTLLEARLTALRREHGLMTETEDYTSEAAFLELEHQFEVFAEFVRVEWKDAKKMLRKDFFASFKKTFSEKFRKKPKEDAPVEIRENTENKDE